VTSDADLELLEAYLDGELTTTEEESLRARMSADPALAATMDALRADRSVRAAVWQSFEPAPAQVDRLLARVHASVDRNTIWAARLSKLRVVTSAAACILLGFVIGRVAHRPAESDGGAGVSGGIAAVRPSGGLNVVQVPQGQMPAGVTNVNNAPAVQFRIVDGNNQPVTLQPFNSAREAQEFIDAWHRWTRHQEQLRNGGGAVPAEESF
jgi:anti-sigma factor RsiW